MQLLAGAPKPLVHADIRLTGEQGVEQARLGQAEPENAVRLGPQVDQHPVLLHPVFGQDADRTVGQGDPVLSPPRGSQHLGQGHRLPAEVDRTSQLEPVDPAGHREFELADRLNHLAFGLDLPTFGHQLSDHSAQTFGRQFQGARVDQVVLRLPEADLEEADCRRLFGRYVSVDDHVSGRADEQVPGRLRGDGGPFVDVFQLAENSIGLNTVVAPGTLGDEPGTRGRPNGLQRQVFDQIEVPSLASSRIDASMSSCFSASRKISSFSSRNRLTHCGTPASSNRAARPVPRMSKPGKIASGSARSIRPCLRCKAPRQVHRLPAASCRTSSQNCQGGPSSHRRPGGSSSLSVRRKRHRPVRQRRSMISTCRPGARTKRRIAPGKRRGPSRTLPVRGCRLCLPSRWESPLPGPAGGTPKLAGLRNQLSPRQWRACATRVAGGLGYRRACVPDGPGRLRADLASGWPARRRCNTADAWSSSACSGEPEEERPLWPGNAGSAPWAAACPLFRTARSAEEDTPLWAQAPDRDRWAAPGSAYDSSGYCCSNGPEAPRTSAGLGEARNPNLAQDHIPSPSPSRNHIRWSARGRCWPVRSAAPGEIVEEGRQAAVEAADYRGNPAAPGRRSPEQSPRCACKGAPAPSGPK